MSPGFGRRWLFVFFISVAFLAANWALRSVVDSDAGRTILVFVRLFGGLALLIYVFRFIRREVVLARSNGQVV